MLIENWRSNKKSWTILGVTLKSCNSCRHSALHDGGVYLLYSYTAHYTAIAPSGVWNLQYVNLHPCILIKSFSKAKNEFCLICPNHMNMHHLNLQHSYLHTCILIKSFSKVKHAFHPICTSPMNMHTSFSRFSTGTWT